MDFKKAVEAAMPALIEDIAKICRINSVEADPLPGMPFGQGVADALEATLKLGEEMGFATENFDNYVGHVEYGDGEEILGILGHVDVVPAGDGWNTDPWGGVVTEDRIVGRGVTDDKGPLVVCMHAMKILKDMNLPLKRKIRVILGTNEETDWGCMNHYINVVKPQLPTVAFSPDSHFPLTYAEKGLVQFTLTKELADVIEVEGGGAFNSVPSIAKIALDSKYAEAVAAAVAASEEKDAYVVEEADGKVCLTANGVIAHAAYLQKGKNAIGLLMKIVDKLETEGELKAVSDFYQDCFGVCIHGENMGVYCEDDDCGPITLNVSNIKVEDGKLVIGCDCRIPVSFTIESIEEKVQAKVAAHGFVYNRISSERPLYVSKDSELVKTLMAAYSKVTGDFESQPQSSGGATYSRAIDNCVAFGPLLPHQEDTMHQANEYLKLDDLKIWLEIMLEAIYQLAK